MESPANVGEEAPTKHLMPSNKISIYRNEFYLADSLAEKVPQHTLKYHRLLLLKGLWTACFWQALPFSLILSALFKAIKLYS